MHDRQHRLDPRKVRIATRSLSAVIVHPCRDSDLCQRAARTMARALGPEKDFAAALWTAPGLGERCDRTGAAVRWPADLYNLARPTAQAQEPRQSPARTFPGFYRTNYPRHEHRLMENDRPAAQQLAWVGRGRPRSFIAQVDQRDIDLTAVSADGQLRRATRTAAEVLGQFAVRVSCHCG